MTKEKQIEALDNNVEIKTTAKGWDKKETAKYPVMFSGWKEGAASHHSIGHALAVAVVNSGKEELKDCVLGNYAAESEQGEEKLVPVVDPVGIHALMAEAFVEKYSLEVPVLRVASNRTSVKKELDSTYQAIAQDPDMMKLLETKNPELFAKISGV